MPKAEAEAAHCCDDFTYTSAPAPLQVLCCSEGLVGTAHDSGRLRTLYREPTASVEGLCLGSAGPCRHLFCVTDQQALVFMANVV